MTPRPAEPVEDIEFASPGRRLARHHSLVPVWLTCNEGNFASQRTLEALGAEFVELRRMPPDYPYVAYYPPEARLKRRYRWLPTIDSN